MNDTSTSSDSDQSGKAASALGFPPGWVLLGATVLLFAMYVGFNWFTSGLIVKRIISQTASPDHDLKAVVFTCDGGATTSLSTQVSVINFEDQPNTIGNVLIIDREDRAAGPQSVSVHWTANRKLFIEYDHSVRVCKCARYVIVSDFPFVRRRVEIDYREH